MSILDETYTLSNGVEIPKLGLGTGFIDDDKAAEAVRAAIEVGYRNIDTAQAYGNERGVGEGVRASGVDRGDLFVSTKLAAEVKDYDGAGASIEGSLETMGLDYVDLMLIHSPQPWADFRGGDYSEGNREAWRALEDAHKAGKVRSIGVSNFLEADLENILGSCTVVPHVNQLLVHAGNTPSELLDYCADKGILVEAYSPIAHGEILDNEQVQEMAARYGVSVPQLSSATRSSWGRCHCRRPRTPSTCVPTPRSTSRSRTRTWLPCATCTPATTATRPPSPSTAASRCVPGLVVVAGQPRSERSRSAAAARPGRSSVVAISSASSASGAVAERNTSAARSEWSRPSRRSTVP